MTNSPRIRSALVCLLLLLAAPLSAQPWTYAHEADLVEVMFREDAQVRLFGGELIDMSGLDATAGVDVVLVGAGGGEWFRLCEGVDEALVDMWAAEASVNLGEPVYNLNNIYRLRFFGVADAALLAEDLMTLPGIELAYPVALPPEMPVPPDYEPNQGYLAT